ncbi:hypothetical protein COCOBI_07-0650 [Coccomyxa sp. Obi]|nr:hypothetical protein COCOBI_07-0650 [Coccomyxa sp. Obi]
MLAELPLLHSQRSNKQARLPACSWLGVSAKLVVLLLICTNLAQLYLLLFQPTPGCNGVAPCQPDASISAPQARMAAKLEAIQKALPPVVQRGANAELPFPRHHFAVFIIFSWNYEMFWASLQTYLAAGWGKRIIIIDNSPNRLIVNDPGVNALVGEVIPTRVRLTFSQAQNMIADIAVERNYTFFFWGHSDVALLASNATAVFAEEAMACLERVMEERPKWGVLFFHYDWFSAVRTDVVREFKYDTFITVYKSDCDFYPRVRQKWRTLNHSSVCRGCRSRVFDMKPPLKLPLDDYEATKAMLEADNHSKGDRNQWKMQEWSIGEQIGWELWDTTSWHYFRYKWGVATSTERQCKIEVTEGDQKRLQQRPFETARDLLPTLMRYQVGEADFATRLHRMF